jgi:hypothetical protein
MSHILYEQFTRPEARIIAIRSHALCLAKFGPLGTGDPPNMGLKERQVWVRHLRAPKGWLHLEILWTGRLPPIWISLHKKAGSSAGSPKEGELSAVVRQHYASQNVPEIQKPRSTMGSQLVTAPSLSRLETTNC